jgi:hypothetical protein
VYEVPEVCHMWLKCALGGYEVAEVGLRCVRGGFGMLLMFSWLLRYHRGS